MIVNSIVIMLLVAATSLRFLYTEPCALAFCDFSKNEYNEKFPLLRRMCDACETIMQYSMIFLGVRLTLYIIDKPSEPVLQVFKWTTFFLGVTFYGLIFFAAMFLFVRGLLRLSERMRRNYQPQS